LSTITGLTVSEMKVCNMVSTIFYVDTYGRVLKSFLLLIGSEEKYDLGGVVGAVIGVQIWASF
jgi:hypothetical protein